MALPTVAADAASETAVTGGVKLNRTLSGWHLWGLAVGLVISGEYFGWSYGWGTAGTLGFLLTTVFVALMYTSFIFSFTKLTAAIPRAGGPFAYSRRALGPFGGFMAGLATLIEFVFAPPAIALAIGSYMAVQFPALEPRPVAVLAYLIFMTLNFVGVSIAATFELVITVLAIAELFVFMGVVAPSFSVANFVAGGWAGSDTFIFGALRGALAAIPFAIWFFLAIEGAAMSAEEVRSPRKNIPRAYLGGIATLVVLAFGVMIFAGGVGDWRVLSDVNDPLPQAMRQVVGDGSPMLHLLVGIGLFGLIASFHGIIMGYSRQFFALARAGFLPGFLARLHPRFRTPHYAILAGGVLGIAAIFSDSFVTFGGLSATATLVTMSVFGALALYILSMVSLFRLRRLEPNLERPFVAPGYPAVPAFALGASLVCLGTMVYFNLQIFALFVSFLLVGALYYAVAVRPRAGRFAELERLATEETQEN